MYNADTELLFPTRVIPSLRGLQGEEWRGLVDHLRSTESTPAERHAFVLMMVRMCGCVGCNADSFRAMRGCTQCSRQMVKRYRSGDHEIVEQFRQVQKEVEAVLRKNAQDEVLHKSAQDEVLRKNMQDECKNTQEERKNGQDNPAENM